jgi:phosphoribosylanthranilate isomerase
VRTVGVFVDAEEAEIERIFRLGAIRYAQLHGHETPEMCQRLAGRAYKAIALTDEHALAQLAIYPGDVILIDAAAAGHGGSGRRIDLELARAAASERRVLLAGGLTPDNVADAVRAVRPYGVDVASGVERAPGKKDWNRVAQFVARAKAAHDF